MRRSSLIGFAAARSGRTQLSSIHAVFRIVWPQRVRFLLGLVAAVISVLLALAQPLAAGNIVASVSKPSAFASYVSVLIVLLILHATTEAVSRYALEVAGERAIREMRIDFVRHILALPMRVVETTRVGDLISRATADTNMVKNLASHSLARLTTGVLGVSGAAVLMFFVDRMLCIVALGSMTVAFVALYAIAPRLQIIAIRSQESVANITSDLERALSEMRTVKANQTEEFEAERITSSIGVVYENNCASARLIAIGNPVVRIATMGSLIVVLVTGGAQVAAGDISPDRFVTMMMYAMYLAAPVGDMFDALSELNKGIGPLRRVHQIESLPVEPVYAPERPFEEAQEHDAVGNSLVHAGGISFDSVEFTYPGANNFKVLNNASFSVKTGEHAGLIGKSGAGKSTIFSLACRLYEPNAGSISIGGRELRAMSVFEARSLIGLVDQHAPILYGTVRENIQYGNERVSDSDIFAVLERVNLAEFIDRLPDGLDSQVGEHGSLLSGGQRQRIALGRALLGKPSVLLLDEPAAMLDPTSEESLIEVLSEVKRTCAILTISHKRSTLSACDTLWKVERGQVIPTADFDSAHSVAGTDWLVVD